MSELARRLMASGKTRSMSEDEVQFGVNPIDELRRTVNTQSYTPEQTAQNRKQSLWEALSVIPGPGNVISAHDAYTGAGDAYNAFSAGDYKGGALASALAGLSGAGAVLGLPFGKMAKGAADSGKDTLNIFAGPMAKTADHTALSKAQEMAQSGASRDDIWRDTGWFQGVDGKWRFEIDDSGAQLSPGTKMAFDELWQGGSMSRPAATGLRHPDLHRAYNDLGDLDLTKADARTGSYEPYKAARTFEGRELPAINEKFSVRAGDPEDVRSVGLHEVQHGVQAREGFARGSSMMEHGPTQTPFETVKEAKAFFDALPSGDKNNATIVMDALTGKPKVIVNLPYGADPRDLYRRTAGEVEARNVQTRMDMSAADRRAKAPWLTQDVPDDQQIVRFR